MWRGIHSSTFRRRTVCREAWHCPGGSSRCPHMTTTQAAVWGSNCIPRARWRWRWPVRFIIERETTTTTTTHHQDPGTKAPTNKLWASVPYGASTQALHMPVTGHASFRIGLPAILRSALVGSQTVAATSGSPPALDIRLAAGPDLMHRPMSLARSLPPWLGWLSQHSTARYGAMATTRSLEKHVPELPAVLGCPSRLPPAAHVSATKPLLPLGWFHPSCLELSCGGGLELPRE